MTSLFLSSWEWECCGERFAVGDTVTLTARPADAEVAALFAPVPAPDLAECHHEDEPPLRVDGTVLSIDRVLREHRVRYVERQVPPPRPQQIGLSVWMAAGPVAPFVRTEDPLPGTARLEPIAALPPRDDGSEAEATPPDEPAEGEIRSRLEGYLVELA